jgi:small subunit ribosomal protein S19
MSVYNGRTYNKIYIDEKMVGHKLGEFSFTRKLGRIHEKKAKKGKPAIK